MSRIHSVVSALIAAWFTVVLLRDGREAWPAIGFAALLGFAVGEFVAFVAKRWWEDHSG